MNYAFLKPKQGEGEVVKVKIKEVHYARDCQNAKELIRDGIYHCPILEHGCHSQVECKHFKKKSVMKNGLEGAGLTKTPSD